MPTRSYRNIQPKLGARCYIDDTAIVIGDVILGDDVSIWPMVVARGDVNFVRIGARSNVQDGTVMHVSRARPESPDGWPCIIGEDTTITRPRPEPQGPTTTGAGRSSPVATRGGTHMLKEFKAFAMRGNVMDMAIGFILGAAFGKIVSSFVGDVLMPPLGLLLGRMDFTNMFLPLTGGTYATIQAAKDAGVPTLNYGMFIQTIVDFIIVAFAIFLVVKAMNAAKRKEEEKPAAPPAPSAQEKLLAEIRDLLKARS